MRRRTGQDHADSLSERIGRLACAAVLLATPALADELQSGVPVTGTLPPFNFTIEDFITVPAGADRLQVDLQGDPATQPDVDLYVKFGRAVQGTTISELNADTDFLSDSFTPNESISITPASQPPLRAGQWFISVLNLAEFNAGYTLTATVQGNGTTPPPSPTEGDAFQLDRGMWWDPNQSGAGIDFQLLGGDLYAIWYTYGSDGNPTWYIASGPYQGHRWEGTIGRFRRDPVSGVVSDEPVGSMTVTFLDPRNAVLEWELDELRGSQRIERFMLSADLPDFNYTGTWYEPAASGYGLTVATQGEVLATVLYFYDVDGVPRWAVGTTSAGGLGEQPIAVPVSVYTGGFCPGCPATEPQAQSSGTVTVDFTSPIRGVLDTQVSLPVPMQGSWNRSGREIEMLSETSPITAKDLIAAYGTPTLFFIECLNHAPTPGTDRWDPVPGGAMVRYSTWVYHEVPGQARAFAMVNQEVMRGQRVSTDPELAGYPNPQIDPRRFGCRERRPTVDALIPGNDKRFTSEGTDQQPELLLSAGNQLTVDMSAIRNQTLLQVIYSNNEMVGMSTQ